MPFTYARKEIKKVSVKIVQEREKIKFAFLHACHENVVANKLKKEEAFFQLFNKFHTQPYLYIYIMAHQTKCNEKSV